MPEAQLTYDDRRAGSAGGQPPAEGPSPFDRGGIDRLGKWLIWILIGLLLVYFTGRVFLLAFAGSLLAVLLYTVSNWISQKSTLSYGWSLALVLLLLVAVIGLTTWRMQAMLVQQVQEFSKVFPSSLQSLRQQMQQIGLDGWVPQKLPEPSAIANQSGMMSRLTGLASGTLTLAVEILVILFVGLYGAAEPNEYRKGLRHLVPPQRRERADEVLHSLGCTLRWWILGKLCSMALVGILVGGGLALLGVKLALLLGLIAALLELIPNFGPVLASVPGLLIAWSQSSQTAMYVALLYLGVQIAESYLILPLIQRQAVELPPALVILAIVLMGLLAGTLGALVATPLLVTVIVLVKMLYIEDYLGDQKVHVMGEDTNECVSS